MEHFASQVGFFALGTIFGAGVLYQKVNTLCNDIKEIKDIIKELPCKNVNCSVGVNSGQI